MIKHGEKVVKTSESHIHRGFRSRGSVDPQWTNYYTAIQDADAGLIRIYYSAASSLEKFQDICSETWYTESPDGVNFSKPKSLHGLHAASSNFHVFRDPLDTEHPYKAVGGQHLRIDHHKKSGCKSKAYQKVWGTFYAAPADNHTCNGEGIYLFQSKDGIRWEKKLDQPIVTGLHEGQTDGLRGISEFDSALSVLFDHASKHYYLYVRLNIKGGVRHIQYAKSPDLENWSPFKSLKITIDSDTFDPPSTGFFNDNGDYNLYYPHFFNFKNKMLGYTAFYEEGNHKQKHAGLYLLHANSPENWYFAGKMKSTGFYNEDPHGPKSSRFKNDRHTVNGLTEFDGKYYLYIQSNYYNFHADEGCYLERYEIDGSHI